MWCVVLKTVQHLAVGLVIAELAGDVDVSDVMGLIKVQVCQVDCVAGLHLAFLLLVLIVALLGRDTLSGSTNVRRYNINRYSICNVIACKRQSMPHLVY